MKKKLAVVFLVFIGFSALPHPAYAEGDTLMDKASDWFATVGKPADERDSIIAQRKAERAAKQFGDAVRSGAKKAGKDMEKMGKEMGKMFDNN